MQKIRAQLHISKNRGITMLLVIIISSLVLAISLGISSILLTELGLSGTVKDTLVAFYATDSGVECALYWDVRTPNGFEDPAGLNGLGMNCAGQAITLSFTPSPPSTTTSFTFSPNNYCVKVEVEKIRMNASTTNTRLQSLGENRPCSAPFTPRTVQRGIEVKYFLTE